MRVCKPKNHGGLGVIDIKSPNDALVMKHLDKFYYQVDIPWVTLTWSKFYSNTQTPPHAS
jgi:ubiquinone/menaquinone biosynthesis C-methylase UbiE